MSKIQNMILKKISAIGKFAAVKAAGSASCAGYHQPKEPEALKKMKK